MAEKPTLFLCRRGLTRCRRVGSLTALTSLSLGSEIKENGHVWGFPGRARPACGKSQSLAERHISLLRKALLPGSRPTDRKSPSWQARGTTNRSGSLRQMAAASEKLPTAAASSLGLWLGRQTGIGLPAGGRL